MENCSGPAFAGTELVSYSNGTSTVDFEDFSIYPNQYYSWYTQEYHHWFPMAIHVTEKSKVEQAFKILGKLLEKKIIESCSAKQFIELVNEIASVM